MSEEVERNRERMASNEVASALSTVLARLGDDALAILGYETYTHATAALSIFARDCAATREVKP